MSNLTLSAEQEYEAAKKWLNTVIELLKEQNEGVKFHDIAKVTDKPKNFRKFNEKVIASNIVDGDIMLRQGITELAAILERDISCKKTEYGIRLSFWYRGNQIIQWLDKEV